MLVSAARKSSSIFMNSALPSVKISTELSGVNSEWLTLF